MSNIDISTVQGFGEEWSAFDQSQLSGTEKESIFAEYFGIFPWEKLPNGAVGIDVGCGSGRWATLVAPKVGRLIASDASGQALGVAKKNLFNHANVEFIEGDVNSLKVPDGSLDFAYSLGVLHHVPDTQGAIRAIATKLKPGAPFLLYLYYAFDNSPVWYRLLWKISDLMRKGISALPFFLKRGFCDLAALVLYWPLARSARALERVLGRSPTFWPLAYYRDKSFYVMRTDSLDRFGTRLEQRFTRKTIQQMLEGSGFVEVSFSDAKPYWTAICYRSHS